MAQHFLLSAKARTISLKAVYQMGEDKAYRAFCDLRWPETDGEAVCPRCGGCDPYSIPTRRKFQCKACGHQFSVTSGTIFAGRKLAFIDLLAAIVLFVNGAKGVSALQISRDMNCQYKTAYVLCHKLREAMAREDIGRKLGGIVETGAQIVHQDHRAFARTVAHEIGDDQLGIRIDRGPGPHIARAFRCRLRGLHALFLGMTERPDFIALNAAGLHVANRVLVDGQSGFPGFDQQL